MEKEIIDENDDDDDDDLEPIESLEPPIKCNVAYIRDFIETLCCLYETGCYIIK